MAIGLFKAHRVNLDIGHFTASNYDAIPYIREYYTRITNFHLKDIKMDHGGNVPCARVK
jgi:sugar phosphate isomerase/epimerase